MPAQYYLGGDRLNPVFSVFGFGIAFGVAWGIIGTMLFEVAIGVIK